MARQIKGRLSSKPKEEWNATSRTNLLGIVKNIFKTIIPKPASEFPHLTQGNSQDVEAPARSSETLLLSRAQMLR
jgi:hypothetical protein